MDSTVKSFSELPAMLNARHLMMALGISRNSAYNLFHTDGFPTQRFGKLLKVTKTDLIIYLDRNRLTDMN